MTSKVYFVQGPGGLIKIGFSLDVPSRIRSLESNCGPLQLRLQLDGGRRLERHLHRLFKDLRRHGEWFEPGPQLLDFIMFAKNFGGDLFPAESSTDVSDLEQEQADGALYSTANDQEGRRLLTQAQDLLTSTNLISRELMARAFRIAPWLKPTGSRDD